MGNQIPVTDIPEEVSVEDLQYCDIDITSSVYSEVYRSWLNSDAVCYKNICLPVGATALVEPWPHLQPVSTVRFLNKVFYRRGLLAPCPTPILEDQGVSLSLDSTL
jgi:hypothetical protein